ncbi:beta-galactosidase GalA [Pseudoxanthomonas sp.]|uniref:beta-galactosidase GalA n=1 Tax=Pseudoxanthomonas sp. TaxID=1871049 RepID=UPI0026079990|nr:beta-galactosidase GalA [Pseudoxanthomonas sp.]WDS36182.1 MAG: beta-galactosidase GalA [Pseudoxanthomonas sp.]
MTELTRREVLLSVMAGSVAAALPATGRAMGLSAPQPPGVTVTAGALAGAAAAGTATPGKRERHAFDDGWRFHLGHANDAARDFGFGTYQRTYAKAGKDTAEAAMAAFDDSDWRAVSLPHDWAVELPLVPNPDAPATGDDPAAAHGYRPLGRNYPETSVGWYRTTLDIPAQDAGRRIVLEFDGVFRDCLVFCNGHVVGANASGYAGFEVDLTDVLDYGQRNVIAVRVDATLGEGWFYEGAGIYRHVWLRKHDPVHVPFGGIAVRCQPDQGQARGPVDITVCNDGAQPANAVASVRVLDQDQRQVAQATLPAVLLPAGTQATLSQTLAFPAPRLWSTQTPHLYQLVTEVRVGGVLRDTVHTPFGVRNIAFDAQRGFLLNGQPLKLKGTCNHQDHAGVGAAIPDALQAWRLQQLRQMGCNAIRTSHNPATPELMDLCDQLGVLVIEETRRMSSDPEAMDELRRLLLRDRNRPSLIAWSLGNEEPQMVTERGVRIVGTMQGLVRRLDPTRPTTFAMDKGFGEGVSQVVDVVGFNYRTNQLDAFHARYPEIPVYGSETASTVSTRGNYFADTERGYARAYDMDHPWWASTSEAWWAFVAERPYVSGGFIWTGFDYRGEPTPYNRWPNVASQFGVLDSCGFPKDNYWYYRAQWTDEPVLHLFPHWNWDALPEVANGMVDVWCHSNLEQVELLVNGVSMGRREVPRHGHVEWRVRYVPGQIEARGFRGGVQVLRQQRHTAGPAAAVVLRTDSGALRGDGRDVAILVAEVVDAKGIQVPDAAHLVSFAVSGPAQVIGVGNGDPSSHEADKATQRRTFNGLCMAVLQSKAGTGTVQIRATVRGLRAASHTLPVTSAS